MLMRGESDTLWSWQLLPQLNVVSLARSQRVSAATAVEWLETEADAAGARFGEVPFSLDWAAGVRAKALASASHL